jgi:hypothetical protein
MEVLKITLHPNGHTQFNTDEDEYTYSPLQNPPPDRAICKLGDKEMYKYEEILSSGHLFSKLCIGTEITQQALSH